MRLQLLHCKTYACLEYALGHMMRKYSVKVLSKSGKKCGRSQEMDGWTEKMMPISVSYSGE